MSLDNQATQTEDLNLHSLEQSSTDSYKSTHDVETGGGYTKDFFTDEDEVRYLNKLEKVDRFINYLKERSISEGNPPYSSVLLSESIWDDLKFDYSGVLPVPLVSLGPDGGVLFTLKQGGSYLELEIFESGVEVFFENESADESLFYTISSTYNIVDSLESLLLEISKSN